MTALEIDDDEGEVRRYFPVLPVMLPFFSLAPWPLLHVDDVHCLDARDFFDHGRC